MTRGRILVTAFLLILGAPAQATADWLVMPFISLNFKGSTTLLDLDTAADDTRVAYGGTVDWLGSGVFGFEADLGYSPGFFEGDQSSTLLTSSYVLTFMGNVVIATPLSWTNLSLRPYASGGLGAMRASADDVLDVFDANNTLLGFNVGGGALGFFSNRTGVRWDLRYFKNVRGADERNVGFGTPQLSFWRASVALVLKY